MGRAPAGLPARGAGKGSGGDHNRLRTSLGGQAPREHGRPGLAVKLSTRDTMKIPPAESIVFRRFGRQRGPCGRQIRLRIAPGGPALRHPARATVTSGAPRRYGPPPPEAAAISCLRGGQATEHGSFFTLTDSRPGIDARRSSWKRRVVRTRACPARKWDGKTATGRCGRDTSVRRTRRSRRTRCRRRLPRGSAHSRACSQGRGVPPRVRAGRSAVGPPPGARGGQAARGMTQARR